MGEEGRISRAMAKAGGGQKLAPQTGEFAPEPALVGPAAAPSPARLAGFNVVQGCADAPDPTVVMVGKDVREAGRPSRATLARMHVASQIRSLRARILATNDGNPPRVITLSSGTREEGKTTMAVNLASALCETDQGRVVVVDGDLLAPALHEVMGVRAETGLNEVLKNELELEGNVYETAIPRLDIVPCHLPDVDDEYERTLARDCKQLLTELRKRYSYVIIDTPPVLGGSQACTFGKHSDAVLLVVRLEKTPREVIKRAKEQLTQSGSNVMGCVLTHRKHHVPDFIYRLFGNRPGYYSRYYYGSRRARRKKRREKRPEQADKETDKGQ